MLTHTYIHTCVHKNKNTYIHFSADSYPFLVGVAVDIGQTAVSNASINALISMNPSVVLAPGDFSYADGFYALWDTFGNLFEPLASKIPVITSGNG